MVAIVVVSLVRQPPAEIQALPQVSSGKFLNLTEPQFLPLKNPANSKHPHRMAVRIQ